MTLSIQPDAQRSVTVRAPAKINLHLGVGRPREDGFHPLDTVFQVVGSGMACSRSPRPVPCADPPSSEKGTSLPSAAASSRSMSSGVPRSQSRSSATRVAAASADPPAMPPATGIRFSTSRSARDSSSGATAVAASRRAARVTMLLSGLARSSSTLAGRYDAGSTVTVPSPSVARTSS